MYAAFSNASFFIVKSVTSCFSFSFSFSFFNNIKVSTVQYVFIKQWEYSKIDGFQCQNLIVSLSRASIVQCMKRMSCTGWISYSIFMDIYCLSIHDGTRSISFCHPKANIDSKQDRFISINFTITFRFFMKFRIFFYFLFPLSCSFECIHKRNSPVVPWTGMDRKWEKIRIVLRA